jgi:phage shock protein PspC (stress-responsive transcriptional regulator)
MTSWGVALGSLVEFGRHLEDLTAYIIAALMMEAETS